MLGSGAVCQIGEALADYEELRARPVRSGAVLPVAQSFSAADQGERWYGCRQQGGDVCPARRWQDTPIDLEVVDLGGACAQGVGEQFAATDTAHDEDVPGVLQEGHGEQAIAVGVVGLLAMQGLRRQSGGGAGADGDEGGGEQMWRLLAQAGQAMFDGGDADEDDGIDGSAGECRQNLRRWGLCFGGEQGDMGAADAESAESSTQAGAGQGRPGDQQAHPR